MVIADPEDNNILHHLSDLGFVRPSELECFHGDFGLDIERNRCFHAANPISVHAETALRVRRTVDFASGLDAAARSRTATDA